MRVKNNLPQALVIGAGIAGIKSALELAECGVKVHVCDISTSIGGALFQMERWFPDNHCGLCKSLPVFDRDLPSQYCLRRGVQHSNIEFHLGSEVTGLDGTAGHFTISLQQIPQKIDPSICTGCGICADVCPAEHGQLKAVYLSNPQALRKTYIIDDAVCNKCGECIKVCPVKAINLDTGPKSFKIEAGAIILSTGFEEFNPETASQYGYRRYPNVITGFDLEHMLNGNSPSDGQVVRPSDGKTPGSICFVQCVGSRDKRNDFCSSTCCMYAAREAGMIKEQNMDARVEIFCMDLRSFGKGHQRYIDRIESEPGIKFTRSRVPVIKQDFKTQNLLINSFDSRSKITENSFDLVVLSASQRPSTGFNKLGEILGIKLNKWGFVTADPLAPVETSRKGIFTCGSATGPRDISESVAASSAAAGMALALLKPGKKPVSEPVVGDRPGAGIAVYICNCSDQISKLVDLSELKEYASGLVGVKNVSEFDRLCSVEQLFALKEHVGEDDVEKVIIAACSSLRPLETVGDIPVSHINIREELIWPHADPVAAIAKSKQMLAMAVESIKWQTPDVLLPPTSIEQRALVIGAGLSGLQSALTIAELGFEVYMIEKSDSPGGHARNVYNLLGGQDAQEYLGDLISRATNNPLIHLQTESEVVKVNGHAGNFVCAISNSAGEETEMKTGAIVVAAGAGEYKPTSYGYEKSKSVITQSELEHLIHSDDEKLSKAKSVVMVQCVESRDEQRPYCSRICCGQALKNSLSLKEKYPGIAVIVLYRDIMSYGFQEEFYTSARERGVLFLRHDISHKPSVELNGEKVEIMAYDASMDKEIKLTPDLLVLSAGIEALADNKTIAAMLGIDLADDGFIREVEPKFQPVDTNKDGIFVCGLANAPMNMAESIVQAKAAGHRAAALLAHGNLEPSRAISEVNERRCNGCGLCVAACPYNARVIDENKRVTVVISELCRGCGSCSAICPNGAATLKELGSKQVFAMLDITI